MKKNRCAWVGEDQLLIDYHDDEYGFAVKDDNIIFERLMLEIYQAGLNWKLILQKREGFNKAFHDYDIKKVSKMSDKELEAQRENPEIIRNKLKIYATRNNAIVSLEKIEEFGSLLNYFKNLPHKISDDPKEDLKNTVKIMKKDGFKFIGPLILDEFFKSIGLNDVVHDENCFLN